MKLVLFFDLSPKMNYYDKLPKHPGIGLFNANHPRKSDTSGATASKHQELRTSRCYQVSDLTSRKLGGKEY
jgi:hypothetical protein